MKSAFQQLSDYHTSYDTGVLPAQAGAIQRREVKIAFMAGAQSMFAVMEKITELPEEEAMEALGQLVKDFESFAKGIR
jgi:hypothetical protein